MIQKDSRHDMLLVDSPNGIDVQESLPLMLSQDSSLPFAVQLTPGYAGQLAADDLQDKDNTRVKTRTQRNWRGGRGQLNAPAGEPERFLDSLCDTRFTGQVMLPPAKRGATVNGGVDPGFGPTDNTSSQQVIAEWNRGGRVDTSRQASVTWSRGARVDISGVASVGWVARSAAQPSNSLAYAEWSQRAAVAPANAAGGSSVTVASTVGIYGVSFVPADSCTLNQIGLYFTGVPFAGSINAGIYTNSAGAPGTLVGTSNNKNWTSNGQPDGWAYFPISASITAGITYWVVMTVGALLTSFGSGTAMQVMTSSASAVAGAAYRDNTGQGWTTPARPISFQTTTSSQVDYQISRLQVAQKFVTPAGGMTVANVQISLKKISWNGTPTANLVIRNQDGFGQPNASQGSGAIAQPGTSYAFQTVTLAASLSANTTYWICVEVDAASSASNTRIQVQADTLVNGAGAANWAGRVYSGGAWSAWGPEYGSFYFAFNTTTLDGTLPYYWTHVLTQQRLAQKFVTLSGGLTPSTVQIRVQRATWTGTPTVTLRIVALDGFGQPSTQMGIGTVADPGTSVVWHPVTLSASLGPSTQFYLMLECNSGDAASAATLYWYGDNNQTYGYGLIKASTDNRAAISWTNQASSLYFIINGLAAGNSYFYTHDRIQTVVAQRFIAGSNISMTQAQVYLSQSGWVGGPTARLRVFSVDGFGQPNAQLASGTVTDPTTSANWRTITGMTVSLTVGTSYWLMLDVDATSETISATINWHGDSNMSYGVGMIRRTVTNYVAPVWTNENISLYFVIDSVAAGGTYFYTHSKARTSRAQSFTTPAGGSTVTFVRFYAQLVAWAAGASGTISIRANSAGEPGSVVVSAALTQATFVNATTQAAWVSVALSTSLTASTQYWLVLEMDAPVVGAAATVNWFGDASGTAYAGQTGTARSESGFAWGAWAVQTFDFYFSINNGSALPGIVTINPVEFQGGWYIAVQDRVYKLNLSTLVFDQVYSSGGTTITALAVFATKIYAALGDSVDMVESSTGASGSWAATSGSRRYTYLRKSGGYLYTLMSKGGPQVLNYTDGAQWLGPSEAITVGTSDLTMTGLGDFANEIMILSTSHLFSMSADRVYQVFDWSVDRGLNNGRNAITWVADGRFYIPLRSGLNAFDGSRMQPVGPNMDDGLPLGEQGRISAMVGTQQWLFAAIDAGAGGLSAVYAWNGQGWHCLAKASAVGKRIQAMGVESLSATGNPRLWFFEDAVPYYIEFPALSDNPRQYSGIFFANIGTVTSSRFGTELAQVPKELQAVRVKSVDCNATTGQVVVVYVETDGNGLWSQVGTVTQSPNQLLEITAPVVQPKFVGAGSTTTVINLQSGFTTDLPVGTYIRVRNSVAQIKTINSATQFTLANALDEVPTAGLQVFSSVPVGFDFRYRLTLVTTDGTKTPVVERVSLQYQPLLIEKLRFTFTVLAADNIKARSGGQYELTAAEVRQRLHDWCRRRTRSYLVAPDDAVYRIKIASVTESAMVGQDDKVKTGRWKTTLTVTADEV